MRAEAAMLRVPNARLSPDHARLCRVRAAGAVDIVSGFSPKCSGERQDHAATQT